MVASGSVEDAIAAYKSRDQLGTASLVSQALSEGMLPPKGTLSIINSNYFGPCDRDGDGSDSKADPSPAPSEALLRSRASSAHPIRQREASRDVMTIAKARAEAYFQQGRPILAACCYLSVKWHTHGQLSSLPSWHCTADASPTALCARRWIVVMLLSLLFSVLGRRI